MLTTKTIYSGRITWWAVFKQNFYNSPVKKVDQSYFRGEVVLQQVLGDENSKELEIYHVSFKNGATTTVHYHETESGSDCYKRMWHCRYNKWELHCKF